MVPARFWSALYIQGRLIIRSQRLSQNVEFLVDTGADQSYLMPADARRLGLEQSRLTRRGTAIGVTGLARDFLEPAVLVFRDEESIYVYRVTMRIAQPRPELERVPSLLGRDVLDNWQMLYSPRHKRLECEVLSAHASTAITPATGG